MKKLKIGKKKLVFYLPDGDVRTIVNEVNNSLRAIAEKKGFKTTIEHDNTQVKIVLPKSMGKKIVSILNGEKDKFFRCVLCKKKIKGKDGWGNFGVIPQFFLDTDTLGLNILCTKHMQRFKNFCSKMISKYKESNQSTTPEKSGVCSSQREKGNDNSAC